jgi:hypothetical protein
MLEDAPVILPQDVAVPAVLTGKIRQCSGAHWSLPPERGVELTEDKAFTLLLFFVVVARGHLGLVVIAVVIEVAAAARAPAVIVTKRVVATRTLAAQCWYLVRNPSVLRALLNSEPSRGERGGAEQRPDAASGRQGPLRNSVLCPQ